ncbi:MAG: hypothetical protein QW291_07865 [Thermofilaceae archaeon]
MLGNLYEKSCMSGSVYTLGHNNRLFKEFIELPLQYGIELLIDIRR